MKYFLIAGEASGDLHASNLMKALKAEDATSEFMCWGGDNMQAAGGELKQHYKDIAFMGFIEVVKHLRLILNAIKRCKADIEAAQPDALILVDYPGFNLRIAEWAKSQGIRVFYYISPQVWAWKEKRVHKIVANTDAVYCILPFEQEFYAKFGYSVEFVGHPLLDAVEAFGAAAPQFAEFTRQHDLDGRPVVALLPGSRRQEITAMLPIMADAATQFPAYQFVVAGAPSLPASFYEEVLAGSDIMVLHGQTYPLLQQATAALVTSGTATLETGLFNVPQVVCYKGSAISYAIARRLVNVKYISLVNLVMDREVVKELIQADFTSQSVAQELAHILPEGSKRGAMLSDYEALKQALGGAGASANTARALLKTLDSTD